MDTDCELKKPLDIFLKNDAFVGFEIDNIISTAIFGAAKGNEWIGKFLNYYDERPFVRENGEFDMLPNTVISTRLLSKYFGLKLNNKKQIIKSNIAVYPSEYFTLDSGTKNNYATHHFSASWHSKPSKYKLYVKRRMGNKIAWYGAYKWLYHSKGLISLLKKKK